MPTFELSDVREFIGPTALTTRCASTPPPTTTATGVTPGHALFDTPPRGSRPPNLERSQRSRTATKRSVQWIEEKEKTKDRSAKVRRGRTRNANRGRGAKTLPSRRSSRRIESSVEPTDTDGNTSEATSYTKGEKQANMEAVVVQVPQEVHSDDDELEYETLVYIPREKLLEELGATNPENYLHTCEDDELRVLVSRFRDYQLSGASDNQKQKDLGDDQAAAVEFEEQRSETAAPPPSTTLLNIGGGHHLAYPPSKDPSVACSPGPSSRPYNHPSNQPHMFNLPHLHEPGPGYSARELSVSPLHDYYRDIDSQFENTATMPENTATEPENTTAEPMVIDPEDTAIEPMAIELEATSNTTENLASDSEINPFLLRPVPHPDPTEPPPSSSDVVVPTSRPASDGIQSRSGSQRADGPQNNGPQLPTPLASPVRIHSNPPAGPTAPGGAHTVQPNSRRSNAPSTSPSLGDAQNGSSAQANHHLPPAPSSSPSLGGAPNGHSTPADARPPSQHASSNQGMQPSPGALVASAQLDAHPASRNSSQGAGAEPSGLGPHRHSASRRSATRATLSPLAPRRPGSSSRRTPSHAGAQPSQPPVPIKVSSNSVSRVGSAPTECRQFPSSLTLLLAEARGDLGAVPQSAEAQAGPSSASNAGAETEAARARTDACVDMRAHRNADVPSASQAQPPTPTPTRTPAPANIMLDNDTERRAAEAERAGQYFNGRKPKPLARDVTGNARQVLVMAKLHLFIFILLNGPYETRLTYLMWVRAIFELTWRQQFPDLAFEWPEVDVAEIMVNYLPTLRCRVKEELRSILELYINFRNPVCNDEDLEYNHALYKIVHPLGFYCVEWAPRKGHYQSEIIPRAIAKALFQGPHSIGVLFGHYFVGDRIPEPMICYILANLQFCIEEWSTGRFKAGDLGDGNMYHKYIAHRMGLKGFRERSPDRLSRLQKEWLIYCRNYSGAALVAEIYSQPILDPSEIREDTPATEIDENESE